MNIESFIKKEYLDIYKIFLEVTGISDKWLILSNLAYLDCLVEGWEEMLDSYLDTNYQVRFMIEKQEDVKNLSLTDEFSIEQIDGTSHLVIPAKDRKDSELAMMFFENVSTIYYILPYMRNDFVPNIRLLTDVILLDAKNKKCTDVHFDNESNLDGTFKFVVNFRQGIYLVRQAKYKISALIIDEIISDMLVKRSTVGHKLAVSSTGSPVRFRLTDSLFPSRCQVSKSIAGKTLVVRLFDFKQAPNIEDLGFNQNTQDMLHKASITPNGLTLVAGVFGSGKGTTLNAVGKEMEKSGKLAIASLDDPIEYLRQYNQFEYSNLNQLEEYIDAFKKMDLNIVFLNEVITKVVAEAVFNLVSAGIHVLTTIHTNRVYKIMYKLEELFGEKYLSLIPFLNVISYQDKFSICCPHCSNGIAKEEYNKGSDEEKLMTFLNLNTLKQSTGCSNCEKGIVTSGIKVVSEHIEFNDQVKSDLLKLTLHEQFDYLKDITSKGENLEDVVRDALVKGEIMIKEAIVKLDTWR